MFERTLLSPPSLFEEHEGFRSGAVYTVGRFPFRVDRIRVRRITQQVLLLFGTTQSKEGGEGGGGEHPS